MKRHTLVIILLIVCVGEIGFLVYRGNVMRRIVPCQNLDKTATILCWEKQVKEMISRKDIDGAFTSLSALYDANPELGQTCHSLTHEIGQAAYVLFARHIDFSVSAKTAYCSYGFYHGFMEALVRDKGDMQQARNFCNYVDKQLSSVSPDVTLQCYHGIGHGTVNNHDPRTWGNEQAMLDPALALCEQVAKTPDQLSRCATGVFNGLAIFYSTGEYKIVLNKSDPLWICRKQKQAYQDACYISMNTLILQLADNDLLRAVSYIVDIPDSNMASHAMINLASPMASRDLGVVDYSSMISTCRTIQPRLHLACIQGYGYGFLEHGAPGKEYVKSIAFCESKQLNVEEQNACFEYIFSYLPMWYGSDKVSAICDTLSADRKSACTVASKKGSSQ